MRTVIIGAGLGGLSAGLRLARSGHDVTVVDRDPAPSGDVGHAFADWQRPSVAQWRQYHVFRARARIELERSLPAVLERLAEIGIASPHDDELAALPVRRPVLEWVLRREVEQCRGVDVHAATAVGSLLFDDRLRRVTGVRLAGGGEIRAELVIDAAGRRSPVGGWIDSVGYDVPPVQQMSSGIAYYTRYYKTLPGADAAVLRHGGVELSEHGFMGHALAMGDAGTIGAIFVVPVGVPAFRRLATVDGWEAAVAFFPRMSEVLHAGVRVPIMAPAAMHGLDDAMSPWQPDGVRGPRGLVHLGDSWLVTNPNLAWGSSVALAHAGALGDSFDEHGPDVDGAVENFHQPTSSEVEQLFASACETDRALQRRWALPSERPSAAELEREALLFSLGRLARHGSVSAALRLGRRMNLLEPPDALWHAEDLLATAREELVRVPFDANRRPAGPDRDEFLTTIGSPRSEPTRLEPGHGRSTDVLPSGLVDVQQGGLPGDGCQRRSFDHAGS